MGGVATPREDLRKATLLLIESASSLGMAVSEVREAVLVLQHIVAGNAPSADAARLVTESLRDALLALGSAWDGLEAANKALGATDE